MKQLDCKGLACPQPVIRCRDVLSELPSPGEALEVIVDNQAAVENVSNFLIARKWAVECVEDNPMEWRIIATPLVIDAGQFNFSHGSGIEPEAGLKQDKEPPVDMRPCLTGKTVIFITSEVLGRGDDSLGSKLMLNFLGTLPEMGAELWRIILVNGGVKLSATEPCLSKLRELAQAGVSILVCGTCLDYYGLQEKRAIGETTNMLDIVTTMQLAGKVIHI